MVYNIIIIFIAESQRIINLEAYSPNDTTLTISWEEPDETVLSYSVSIINLSNDAVERQESVSTTNITQTSLGMYTYVLCTYIMCSIILVAGAPYNVSIAAVNRAGPGELTVFIHFTRELVPSIAPNNVTISRPSPTVIGGVMAYSEARGCSYPTTLWFTLPMEHLTP